MLYFKIMCFLWAAIGIISRIAMAVMKDNWNKWETTKAYKEKKTLWIYIVCIVGLILIALTWYIYIVYSIPYGWILGILISLTGIKILTLMFNYNKFQEFLHATLYNPKKMLRLNISVIILSLILIAFGIWLY
ncbi:hypothetical protein [Vallitalea guaymasensis]|uniref:hypothetical protein n=1 Tax=Vallitalea guaymasensis TaxID=1185412 RepID=UPI000DE23039|nr:hypothetical protein [Vallitalea guaymasensis]